MAMQAVNPDLAKARDEATFDPLHVTHFLYNGLENTRRKRYIQNLAIDDFKRLGFRRSAHLSREEHYEEALKKSCFAFKRMEELGITDMHETAYYRECLFGDGEPFVIHSGAFVPTLLKLATEDQKAKWLPLIESFTAIGTYAQTELGHGSFLRGLETTATYDEKTKEFIINSPTITSAKWWPGGLGKTSNCCVVMAKLLIRGKDLGMQSFIVPIRDVETHQPLPGISVGDIGPKFGFMGVDNGYVTFDNIRIPRENMLMRYSQVLEDGTFVQPKNDRLIYGSMTLLRTVIVKSCGIALAKAATIATRYSAVRKQSKINPREDEVPVMAFQTQQHKVFTQIATAYALLATAKACGEAYGRVSSQIEKGNFEELPILHALTSGLKSFSSWSMMDGIEQCRLACGGHGYMLASGLPKIYAQEVPAATYEGENTVLCLQTARFLMKCQAAVAKGEQLPPMMAYLKRSKGEKSQLTEKLELRHLIDAFQHYSAKVTSEAAARVTAQLVSGVSPAEASNNASQLLVDASVAFSQAFTVQAMIGQIQGANFPASVREVMTQVCQLYACYGINRNSGHFLKGGYMSDSQIEMVQRRTYDLLAALRPNAVALVDAFDFPDQVLDSDLGRYDGNVYEALFEFAKSSKLNETEVHPAFYKYQKPFMEYMKNKKTPQSRL